MSPEDVDQFVRFNEPRGGPSRRLQLIFASNKYAIILLNDEGLLVREFLIRLEGCRPKLSASKTFGGDAFTMEIPEPKQEYPVPEKEERKYSGWEVYFDGASVLVPVKSSKCTGLPPCIGIIITGKESFWVESPIIEARFLDITEPTPFISDRYGDSWNSNYYIEPRLVERVPSTIFEASESILCSAKRAFDSEDFETATIKYKKAFHYCYCFFPDSLTAEDLSTATNLKIKSLLNLSLAALRCQTKLRYATCSEACDVLLQMPECVDLTEAKALYRKAKAILMLGDDTQAKSYLEKSLRIVYDPKTVEALQECDAVAARRKISLREKLATAFTE